MIEADSMKDMKVIMRYKSLQDLYFFYSIEFIIVERIQREQ